MNGYACRFHLHVYRRYCQEAAAFFRAITVHISQVLCLRPADCQSGRGFHVHGGGTVCCSKNWRMVPHLEAQTFEPWLHSRISNHNETRCMGMEIELRWMEVTAFCHEPLSESDFGFIIKNNNTASWLVGKDWHKVPQLHFWTFKRNQPIARKTFIVIGFLFGLWRLPGNAELGFFKWRCLPDLAPVQASDHCVDALGHQRPASDTVSMEPLSVGGVFDVCLHVFLACKCLNRFQLVVSDYDLQLSTVIFSNKNAADDFSKEWNWLCHWWPFGCPILFSNEVWIWRMTLVLTKSS